MARYLVVGAGFSGAVLARELAEAGHYVDVIDQRKHIAGNAYDFTNDVGIRMHAYGPHLFHTNNKRVYDYLARFTEWVPYEHKVKAKLADGRLVTLPVNRETKEIVGEENIIDIFYRPYTRKMWGLELEQLDPTIMQRVPVRNDMNELYFPNDTYQAMPRYGYTYMIYNILNHDSIYYSVGTAYDKLMEKQYDHVFNSMPIDVYYDSEYGQLPYRSIKFKHINLPIKKLLPVATVNFTDDGPVTRMTEWKNIVGHDNNQNVTTITFETPCDYSENFYERYYPVKDISGENRARYEQYASIKNDKVTFIGRCGKYVYIDMDQSVNMSLMLAAKFLAKHA
jgi:UDP-galactopyranose mutase